MTTILADVTRLPANAFGYVPTPAIVAPIEFTLPVADYAIPHRRCSSKPVARPMYAAGTERTLGSGSRRRGAEAF